MLGTGVKRIIFSIYNENLKSHSSVSDYKRTQFKKYKDQIQIRQKEYAFLCKSDYELFSTIECDYDKLQFDKIIQMEKLAEYYDEILYLDFDVIPKTDVSFFQNFNLDNLCVYSLPVDFPNKQFRYRMIDDNWHKMDMYVKTCAKNAMLLLDDISGLDECMNTGVVGANKKSLENLMFSERLDSCIAKLEESKLDNLYPENISKVWQNNNEVFISYIVEKFKVPYINIGLQWNFILDHVTRNISAGAHMLHCVNKEFEKIFNPSA